MFFSLNLEAQNVLLQKEVTSLLHGTNTQKLILYGYFDNKFEVQLYLIHDNKDWAGVCYYPSSDTKINLEGGMIDDKLILNESDSLQDNIGMWKIDINEPEITAKWMNPSGRLHFDMILKPIANKKIAKELLSVDTYEGEIINNNYNIIIYNIDRNIKKAVILNLNKAKYLTNVVKCKNKNCTDFNIIINGDKKIRRLECHQEENNILKINIYNQFITKFTAKLKKISSFENRAISFINKAYRYYISFPLLKSKSIHFDKEMRVLAETYKMELDKLEKSKLDLENRLQLSANAWFDVDFISNNVISGTIISQKSYEDEIKTTSIIIKIKNGKYIDVKKQFKSDFNYGFFINQFLKNEINTMYKDKTISKWYHLKPNDFKNITICKAGIVYSTKFNSIIGTIKVIIPYGDIKDKLTRKSIFKKIML